MPTTTTKTAPATKHKTYVMFQNAGVTDFYALYLVGFTDKAGDPDSIGMFGSGFKLAVTHVRRLFDCCPPEIKTEIIRFAIEQSQDGVQTLESSLYWSQSRRPDAWVHAFRRAFPDHVLCSFSDVEYQSMIRMGRKAVRATREFYRLLSAHGVQTAERVLRAEEETKRQVFELEGILKENYEQAFAKICSRLPEINRLNISFVRLPPSERNVSFVTCSRARAEYQFSETLLKSGPKAVAIALIDVLAQTKSLSGKCDLDYEQELMRMVLECVW